MADAVVSFAVERLGDLLISESKILYGVSNQVNEVRRELKRMQNFLKEADKKQIQDERVRGWVDEIKELAFRTEDVIEIFALQQVATSSGFKEVLRRFASISSQLISRRDIGMEINGIKDKLANIQQSLATYGITKGLEQGETSNSQANPNIQRIFYPHDVEKYFFGMEKEIEQLVSQLKKKDKDFEVVSIWGMGGLGKTTLAQKLYNHVEIRDHFKAFAWVCITQKFDREKVLKGILKQLLPHDRKGEVSNMEDTILVDELRKVQQENNCLIVIDDIWTVDSWSLLKPAFPLGETSNSCKILLTTRHLTVAEVGSVCKIRGLTEDEGWQLLSKKARIYDQPDIRVASVMETIGRNMVNRCKGLPLAISTLGGILKGKHLLREWERINTDVSFYVAKGGGVTNDDDDYHTVRQVLGLSYDNLPSRLRHCFLCFANYKEDEIIKTEELYMFWIAEGLISVENKAQGEMMLDVAESYLDELAHRSLVKVETHGEGDSWSKYKECVVHDLIQDLCLSKVKEQGVINVIDLERKRDNESKAGIVRRLCVRSYDANRDVLELYDRQVLAHTRSLFIWNDVYKVPTVWPDNIFSLEKFNLLRVLTARGYKLSEENVRSISELVYLKYLCLQGCELNILPSSIGKLRNLETLDVRTLYDSLSIPNILWKLKMLKHLYLPGLISVRGRAKKLRLKGLNELELIYNFNSEYCDARDLLGLPNLKVFQGEIWIEANITAETIIDFAKSRKLRHTVITVKGREVSLVLLLECCFIDDLTIGTSTCVIPKVYDYTRFSEQRLTKLSLFKCIFKEDPMILLGNLPNLRVLGFGKSGYLVGREIVCSAMSFQKLEELILHGLRGWRLEEGAMPNLSKLVISHCSELEMLPEGLRHLTCLKSLHIYGMPSRFTDKIKVIDGVEGEDFYKVRHIPCIYI